MRPGERPGSALVHPRLRIGEYPTPADAAWLRDTHGVTAVVCLQDHGDLAAKGLRLADLARAYAAHGITFDHEPIPDGDEAAIGVRLDALVARLHALITGGATVYVHCNAGYNRAPTVAIAYLHVHANLSLAAAQAHLKSLRPCVPFMRLLEKHFTRD